MNMLKWPFPSASVPKRVLHACPKSFSFEWFAQGLVLKLRQKATQKWPTSGVTLCKYLIVMFIKQEFELNRYKRKSG